MTWGQLWRISKNFRGVNRGGAKAPPILVGKMKTRKLEEDYKKVIGRDGLRWIGETLPKNTNARTLWECSQGHVVRLGYNNIYQGVGCRFCKMVTEDDYKVAIGKNGLGWVGESLPTNTHTMTLWRCDQGHIIKCTYNRIVDCNQGCAYCYGNIPKTLADYQIARGKNGARWADKKIPPSVGTPTSWTCSQGHRWKAAYSNVVYNNTGCPYCVGKLPKTIEDYKNFTGNDGIKWAGRELPFNTKTTTVWICSKGHYRMATYQKMVNDNGRCSICNQTRGERAVALVLHDLGIKFQRQRRFPDCRYKNPLPFDFCVQIKDSYLLIEYDGELHYREGRFSNASQALLETQRNDRIKDKWANDNGYTLVRIPYTEFDNIETILRGCISQAILEQ